MHDVPCNELVAARGEIVELRAVLDDVRSRVSDESELRVKAQAELEAQLAGGMEVVAGAMLAMKDLTLAVNELRVQQAESAAASVGVQMELLQLVANSVDKVAAMKESVGAAQESTHRELEEHRKNESRLTKVAVAGWALVVAGIGTLSVAVLGGVAGHIWNKLVEIFAK